MASIVPLQGLLMRAEDQARAQLQHFQGFNFVIPCMLCCVTLATRQQIVGNQRKIATCFYVGFLTFRVLDQKRTLLPVIC